MSRAPLAPTVWPVKGFRGWRETVDWWLVVGELVSA